MGQTLSGEVIQQRLELELGVPSKLTRPMMLSDVQASGQHACCLVSSSFVDCLVKGDPAFKEHLFDGALGSLSDSIISLFLQASRDLNEPDLRRVCVRVLEKNSSGGWLGEDKPSPPVPSLATYMAMKATEISEMSWKNFSEKFLRADPYTDLIPPSFPRRPINEDFMVQILTRLTSCSPSIKPVSRDLRIWVVNQANQHPNIARLLSVVESSSSFYVFMPYSQYSLDTILTFCPAVLSSSPTRAKFVAYQMVKGMQFLHERGLVHGDLRANSILIDKHYAVKIANIMCFVAPLESTNSFPHPALDTPLLTHPFEEVVKGWMGGSISNFDYLMVLNHMAGRRMGDANNHPVMPWVVDFSTPEDGWRDLTKTKFRLAKGDEQLDITYGSDIPHHISDILSEVTYYTYVARRSPREVLCRCVRHNWVPNEYPSSMSRMYDWTPDECIPEFYSDESILESIHSDLSNLGIPSWCSSPAEFIKMHRAALESDHVSQELHHWIDLTFGYKLSGRAAIQAKNVSLSLLQAKENLTNHGVVQLFTAPHPVRTLFRPLPQGSRASTRSLPSGSKPSIGSQPEYSRENSRAQDVAFSDSPFEKEVSGPGSNSLRPNSWKPSQPLTPYSGKQGSEELLETSPSSSNPGPGSVVLYNPATLASPIPTQRFPQFKFAERLPRLGLSSNTPRKPVNDISTMRIHITEPAKAFMDPLLGGERLHIFLSKTIVTDQMIEKSSTADLPRMMLSHTSLFAFDFYELGVLLTSMFCDDGSQSMLLRKYYGTSKKKMLTKIGFYVKKNLGSLVPLALKEGISALLAQDGRCSSLAQLTISASPNPLLYFASFYSDIAAFFHEVGVGEGTAKLEVVKKWLPKLFLLNDAGFALVTPIFVDVLRSESVCLKALDLFDQILSRYGQRLARFHFLRILSSLHESGSPDVQAKVLSSSFISIFVNRFGLLDYCDQFASFLVQGIVSPHEAVSKVALSSYSHVARHLGIAVCLRYFLKPTLRHLVSPSPSLSAQAAVDAICVFVSEFGELFAINHVFPFISSSLETLLTKLTPRLEHTLLNLIKLARYSIVLFRMNELMEILQSFSNKIVHLFLKFVTLPSSLLSTECRRSLVMKVLDLVLAIIKYVGREPAKLVFLPVIAVFFSTFNLVFKTIEDGVYGPRPLEPGDDLESLQAVCTNELAAWAYTSFCIALGQETVRRELPNIGLIEFLNYNCNAPEQVYALDPALPAFTRTPATTIPSSSSSDLSSYRRSPTPELEFVSVELEGLGDGVGPTLSRISKGAPPLDLAAARTDAWVNFMDYENNLFGRAPPLSFHNVLLHRFQAHPSSIKCARVLDNENMFLTGSRDKTVKLWSLSLTPKDDKQATCRRTYPGHRRSVSSLLHLQAQDLIASCDGSVHVWSPESGSVLQTFDMGLVGRSHVIGMAAYNFESIVTATSDGYLKFIDTRAGCFMHEWRPAFAGLGTLRCMASCPEGNWVVAGYSSGWVSLVDLRSGSLLNAWKAHEADVLDVRTFGADSFLSISADRSSTLWGATEAKALARLGGHTDVVQAFDFARRDLMTLSPNNKFILYQNLDLQDRAVSGTLQRLSGVASNNKYCTTVSICAMSQLVLIGTESGSLGIYY